MSRKISAFGGKGNRLGGENPSDADTAAGPTPAAAADGGSVHVLASATGGIVVGAGCSLFMSIFTACDDPCLASITRICIVSRIFLSITYHSSCGSVQYLFLMLSPPVSSVRFFLLVNDASMIDLLTRHFLLSILPIFVSLCLCPCASSDLSNSSCLPIDIN